MTSRWLPDALDLLLPLVDYAPCACVCSRLCSPRSRLFSHRALAAAMLKEPEGVGCPGSPNAPAEPST